jgi:hypothetical protein
MRDLTCNRFVDLSATASRGSSDRRIERRWLRTGAEPSSCGSVSAMVAA